MNEVVKCNNIAQIKSDMQKICTEITECRKSSGQTQKQVAEWVNISLRTYIELEKGNCTVENLCVACSKFSIDLRLNFEQY